MRLLVKVGAEDLVMVFPKSATIGEIIPQIEQMASDLRDDGKKVAIKGLKSSQGVLMKTAFLHELLSDGGQVEAVLAGVPSSSTSTPTSAVPDQIQSFPPITETATRRYEGERNRFKLELNYSARTYTWTALIDGYGGWGDSQYTYDDTQTVSGAFIRLGDKLILNKNSDVYQCGGYGDESKQERQLSEITLLSNDAVQVWGSTYTLKQ